ncbi:rhomboid-like protein [Strigomonas culicis]|uniref:Rhomboid-like protein n=1 Tax=Strigomonas culicis TaxID=28005 RepID=S9TXM9_9TRYP|nr:serine peptidase, Clan S-, family S54 [Strigomonas culicis]EPY27146.1 rhomboid-like protein [Strigomonas culicis]|eukprot:EPY21398.1 serine peptidase, Clan S-, family S54 [Strigomonas culicis]
MDQKIDPLCALIRLAPVGVMLLVHCVHVVPSATNPLDLARGRPKVYYVSVRWPTDGECLQRVLRYGFSVNAFENNRWTLLTHLFIHGSTDHLASNLFSLSSALMEFGGTDLHSNMTEWRVLTNVRRMLGSVAVMVIGGVVGGLGFQLLYNDSKMLPYRRELERLRGGSGHAAAGDGVAGKLAHAVQHAGEQLTAAVKGGGGGSAAMPPPNATSATIAISSDNVFSRALAGAGRHLSSWKAQAQLKLQEHMNDSMFMCGASAGICAVAGFNVTYYRRPMCALCIVLPELITFGQQLYAGRSGGGEGFWYTLLPGTTVGHAAHVGGFLAGVAMGTIARQLWPRRVFRRNGREVEQN